MSYSAKKCFVCGKELQLKFSGLLGRTYMCGADYKNYLSTEKHLVISCELPLAQGQRLRNTYYGITRLIPSLNIFKAAF